MVQSAGLDGLALPARKAAAGSARAGPLWPEVVELLDKFEYDPKLDYVARSVLPDRNGQTTKENFGTAYTAIVVIIPMRAGKLAIETAELAGGPEEIALLKMIASSRGLVLNLVTKRGKQFLLVIKKGAASAEEVLEEVKSACFVSSGTSKRSREQSPVSSSATSGRAGRTFEARHITGAADRFAAGTTREQLQDAAEKIVAKGLRISSPGRRIQTFQMRMTINGKRKYYRVVVDTYDNNRVITMFPSEGGG